jgi:hypothetical protein
VMRFVKAFGDGLARSASERRRSPSTPATPLWLQRGVFSAAFFIFLILFAQKSLDVSQFRISLVPFPYFLSDPICDESYRGPQRDVLDFEIAR